MRRPNDARHVHLEATPRDLDSVPVSACRRQGGFLRSGFNGRRGGVCHIDLCKNRPDDRQEASSEQRGHRERRKKSHDDAQSATTANGAAGRPMPTGSWLTGAHVAILLHYTLVRPDTFIWPLLERAVRFALRHHRLAIAVERIIDYAF